MRSRTTRSTGSASNAAIAARAVADDGDRVPVALEVEPEDLAQAGLVLDDQDPGAGDHGPHPSRARCQGNVKTAGDHPHTFLTWPADGSAPGGRLAVSDRHEDPHDVRSFGSAGFAGLLVATALVGGTIIGSVAASTAPPRPRPAGSGRGRRQPGSGACRQAGRVLRRLPPGVRRRTSAWTNPRSPRPPRRRPIATIDDAGGRGRAAPGRRGPAQGPDRRRGG